MGNNSVARSLVRIFGVFLFVDAIAQTPQVIYATVSVGGGTSASVFFFGIFPTTVRLLVGIILFVNPGLIFRDIHENDYNAPKLDTPQLETTAISLFGLYLLIKAALDLIFQISLGMMRLHNHGRFFYDYESAANALASVIELAIGYGLIYGATKIRAKLSAYRQSREP